MIKAARTIQRTGSKRTFIPVSSADRADKRDRFDPRDGNTSVLRKLPHHWSALFRVHQTFQETAATVTDRGTDLLVEDVPLFSPLVDRDQGFTKLPPSFSQRILNPQRDPGNGLARDQYFRSYPDMHLFPDGGCLNSHSTGDKITMPGQETADTGQDEHDRTEDRRVQETGPNSFPVFNVNPSGSFQIPLIPVAFILYPYILPNRGLMDYHKVRIWK